MTKTSIPTLSYVSMEMVTDVSRKNKTLHDNIIAFQKEYNYHLYPTLMVFRDGERVMRDGKAVDPWAMLPEAYKFTAKDIVRVIKEIMAWNATSTKSAQTRIGPNMSRCVADL